jgi:hypothetical protein
VYDIIEFRVEIIGSNGGKKAVDIAGAISISGQRPDVRLMKLQSF